MTKDRFLRLLRTKLWKLSKAEREEHVSFYSEMISDRMEEGLSEAEAVRAIGSTDAIAEEILGEAKEKRAEAKGEGKPLSGMNLLLLALGFPLWFLLLVAAFAVTVSLFAVLLSVVISLWAVFLSLAISGVAGIAISVAHFIAGGTPMGFALLGASLVALGLAIFLFYGCKEATKRTVEFTKKAFISVKNRISGKEWL